MIKKKIFKFADYDLIGFNLDHTVVRYDFNALVKAQYHFLVEYLIRKKLYPPECFGKITDADINFLCRGTFIDTANGNFLKVDNMGQIIRATNGTRPLSPQEMQKIYGKKKQFRPLLDYLTNLMKTYKLASSPKVDCYTDYYQCAGILIYIKTIDFCRDHKLKKKLKLKTLWMDIEEGLNAMADKSNKECEWDTLMPTYKLKTDPRLALWLAELRKSSSLMLITSCTPYAADLRMTTAFSPKWRELFDFVVYNVDRFLFFRESANFCDLEGRLVPFTGEGEYVEGSIDAIDRYLKRELQRVPKIVYAGGASLHDILAPRCDVLGLIAELTEHPYFVGLAKLENAAWVLSNTWGQLDSDEDILTIWGRALEEKTKFCAPTLSYFTHQTTTREFHPHWLETVDTYAIKELVKEKMRVSRTSRAYLDPKNDEETKKVKEHQSTNVLPRDINQSNRNGPNDSLQVESKQKLIVEPKEKSQRQGPSTQKTQSTTDEQEPNPLETPSTKFRDMFNRSKLPELKEKIKVKARVACQER
uniref:5'-nucleotidase domain-containing protein 1 n=2 Tax=Lygus hesperus TaxID=30085 RepID=A0A0A9ZF02_LYGHE